MENTSSSFFPISLKYGLIGSAIGIVFYLVLYFINPTLIYSLWWLQLVSMAITLVLMFMACKEYREVNGDVLTFGKGFLTAFFTYLVSAIVGVLFMLLMTNVVDTDLKEIEKQISVETSVKMMEWVGTPDDVIEEQIDVIEKQFEKQSPITYGLTAIFWSSFIGAIFSLIIAAITKRKPQKSLYG